MAKLRQTRVAKLVRKVQASSYGHALKLGFAQHTGNAHDAYRKGTKGPTRVNARRQQLAGAMKHQRSLVRMKGFGKSMRGVDSVNDWYTR